MFLQICKYGKLSHQKHVIPGAGIRIMQQDYPSAYIKGVTKSNMVEAGVNEVYRDMLLGHSKQAMDKYSSRLDDQIKTAQSEFVDQAVDLK
jgi:hypothetical protein